MTSMYRADVIGSLLRPTPPIEARGAWEAGRLATPQFKWIEDRAVDEAIGLHISRIEEASRYFPRERLALSTQCGFASIAIGSPISRKMQEAKLRLVAEVARRVWA